MTFLTRVIILRQQTASWPRPNSQRVARLEPTTSKTSTFLAFPVPRPLYFPGSAATGERFCYRRATMNSKDPLAGIFRYYQVSVSASQLPGYGRLDPVAVVYTGGNGKHTEIGRTRSLANQWNPSFPEVFYFPADSAAHEASDIRIDLYDKKVSQDRFLGTSQCQLHHIIKNSGRPLALPFQLAETGQPHPKARVTLAAVLAYNKPGGEGSAAVRVCLELEQTNYYGVSQRAFFEVSRGSGGASAAWVVVCTSAVHGIDAQGWCQFPPLETSLRQIAMDQPATPLLVSLYRHRSLGRNKKLLGHFQFSLAELMKMSPGAILPFAGNAKEDLLSASVRVECVSLSGTQYDIVLKLVNVRWRADTIPAPEGQTT